MHNSIQFVSTKIHIEFCWLRILLQSFLSYLCSWKWRFHRIDFVSLLTFFFFKKPRQKWQKYENWWHLKWESCFVFVFNREQMCPNSNFTHQRYHTFLCQSVFLTQNPRIFHSTNSNWCIWKQFFECPWKWLIFGTRSLLDTP